MVQPQRRGIATCTKPNGATHIAAEWQQTQAELAELIQLRARVLELEIAYDQQAQRLGQLKIGYGQITISAAGQTKTLTNSSDEVYYWGRRAADLLPGHTITVDTYQEMQ